MPKIFLSPSTQEWNKYATDGNEELYMNLLADRMEHYLRSCGISYVRNDPDRNVTGAINDSNAGRYDVHLALHSNASPAEYNTKRLTINVRRTFPDVAFDAGFGISRRGGVRRRFHLYRQRHRSVGIRLYAAGRIHTPLPHAAAVPRSTLRRNAEHVLLCGKRLQGRRVSAEQPF